MTNHKMNSVALNVDFQDGTCIGVATRTDGTGRLDPKSIQSVRKLWTQIKKDRKSNGQTIKTVGPGCWYFSSDAYQLGEVMEWFESSDSVPSESVRNRVNFIGFEKKDRKIFAKGFGN